MARWDRSDDGPMPYGPGPEHPAEAQSGEPAPIQPPAPMLAPPPAPDLPPPPPTGAPQPISPWAPPPGAYGTPMAGAATLQYGRTLDRAMAYLLDAFIIGIPVVVLTLILERGAFSEPLRTGGVTLVSGIIGLGIHLLYFLSFWTGDGRATPGMRLMKLQIGDARTGGTVTVQQGLVRWLALGGVFQLLALVPLLVGLGALLALIWEIALLATTASSPTKQGLHDRIANTAIVQPLGAQTPATTCLLIAVALFVLWIVAVVLLIFLGAQMTHILSGVGSSI